MKSIRIYCKNDGRYHDVPKGATLEEVYETLDLNLPCCVTSCKVNNRVEGLHYTINDSRDLEYLTLASPSGLRTYTRSLFFVLYKAVRDLYPEAELRIGTPVAGGYFCRLALPGGITPEVPERLRRRMAEIVASDLPFRRVTAHTTDAIEVFRRQGFTRKVLLLESIGDLYTHYYTLGDTVDYFYSALLLRTGQLTVFDLVPFGEGLLLRVPDSEHPERLRPMTDQHKMFSVFQEQHRRQEILGCTTVGELNTLIRAGRTNDLVNVAEALQEKQIAQIADHIASHDALRVVLIAGPVGLTVQSPHIRRIDVESAREMHAAALREFPDCAGAILCAAVADYAPEAPADRKIKRETTGPLTLRLVPNPDIAADLGLRKRADQWLVGFALETDHALDNARGKLHRKHLDLIVLNSLSDAGAGFNTDTNRVTLIAPEGEPQALPLMAKSAVADTLIRHLCHTFPSPRS